MVGITRTTTDAVLMIWKEHVGHGTHEFLINTINCWLLYILLRFISTT